MRTECGKSMIPQYLHHQKYQQLIWDTKWLKLIIVGILHDLCKINLYKVEIAIKKDDSLTNICNYKISTIIPIYNAEKYIRTCLDSVLTQSFQDFRIIVIDDKSTDKSLQILKAYAEAYPKKVK